MDVLNYLDFVKTIAFLNFGAALWHEKGNSDPIESIFKNNTSQNYFSRFEVDEFDKKGQNTENWRRELIGDRSIGALSDVQKEFLEKKVALGNMCSQMTAIIKHNKSKKRSLYFSSICVLLGLFGLLQCYLLPLVQSHEVALNIYLYTTEFIGILATVLLWVEIRYARGKQIRFNENISCPTFIVYFALILLISVIWACIGEPLFPLLIEVELFLLLSFVLPLISYVVYFCLSCYNYIYRAPKDMERTNLLLGSFNNTYKDLESLYARLK